MQEKHIQSVSFSSTSLSPLLFYVSTIKLLPNSSMDLFSNMPIYLFLDYNKVNKHYHEKYVTTKTGSSAQDVEPKGMIWRLSYHDDVIGRRPKILVVGNYGRSLNTYPWRFFCFPIYS